jgi:hypothetical protein
MPLLGYNISSNARDVQRYVHLRISPKSFVKLSESALLQMIQNAEFGVGRVSDENGRTGFSSAQEFIGAI